MCWTHGLYDAMIYVYTRGLNDYITPLRELLMLLNRAVSADLEEHPAGDAARRLSEDEQALGYKLLRYISYCLAGMAFPQGDIPPEVSTLCLFCRCTPFS